MKPRMPLTTEQGPLTRKAQIGALDLYVRAFYRVALTETELNQLNILVGSNSSDSDVVISAFLATLN